MEQLIDSWDEWGKNHMLNEYYDLAMSIGGDNVSLIGSKKREQQKRAQNILSLSYDW